MFCLVPPPPPAAPWQGLGCPLLGDPPFLQAIKAEQGFLWPLQRNSFFPSLAEGRNINPAGLNTRQVTGLRQGEHKALHPEPAAAATTVGVHELSVASQKHVAG